MFSGKEVEERHHMVAVYDAGGGGDDDGDAHIIAFALCLLPRHKRHECVQEDNPRSLDS